MKTRNKLIGIFTALSILGTSIPAFAYAEQNNYSKLSSHKKFNKQMEINIPAFLSYSDDVDDDFFKPDNTNNSNCKYYKYTNTISNGKSQTSIETNMTTDEAAKYGINPNYQTYYYTTDDAAVLNTNHRATLYVPCIYNSPIPSFFDDDFNTPFKNPVINIYINA